MTDVHHDEALLHTPDLAFTETNLRSLCKGCHGKVEQMERAGEPTQQLFV